MQGGGGGGGGGPGQQTAPPPPPTEGYFSFELPFDFPFFGEPYTNITICTEGYIVFGSAAAPQMFTESPSPFPAGTEPMIAAWWMDFDPEGGSVYVQGDDEMVIVTYESVPYTTSRRQYSPMAGSTFQILLFRSGDVVLQYKTLGRQETAPTELSVGFQNRGASSYQTVCTDSVDSSCPSGNSAYVMYAGANHTWQRGCQMCPVGYKLADSELNYEDVDECATNNGYCDPLATGHPTLPGNNFPSCANSVGSYSCGECPDGFLGVSSFDQEDGSGGCYLPNASDLGAAEAPVIPTADVMIVIDSNTLDDEESKARFLDEAIADLAAALDVPAEYIAANVVASTGGERRALQQLATTPPLLRVSVLSAGGPLKMAELGRLLADNSSALWLDAAAWLEEDQAAPFTVEYICPKGKVRGDGATSCAPCSWPQYTPDARQCMDCPIYQTPTDQGDACECQAGYFNSNVIRPSCNAMGFLGVATGDPLFECWPCEGMECVKECQGDIVTIHGGWTTLAEPGPDQAVYLCKDAAACPGGDIADSQLIDCIDGYDLALCGVCSSNYTLKGDGSCQQCPQSTRDLMETFFVVGVIIFVLVILIKTAPIWWNYFTVLQDVVAMIYELHVDVILKIMISTLQIVGNIAGVLGIGLPSAVTEFLDTYVGWIKLDFVSMFKLGCLSSDGYVASLTTNVGLVVVILVTVATLYLFQLRKVDSLYAVDDEDTKSDLQQLYDEHSTEGKGLDETGLGKAVRRIDANMSDDDLAVIFSKADTDKTGLITFDKWCAAIIDAGGGGGGGGEDPDLRMMILTQNKAEVTNAAVDRAFLVVFIIYPVICTRHKMHCSILSRAIDCSTPVLTFLHVLAAGVDEQNLRGVLVSFSRGCRVCAGCGLRDELRLGYLQHGFRRGHLAAAALAHRYPSWHLCRHVQKSGGDPGRG